jgi:hypothetical protein
LTIRPNHEPLFDVCLEEFFGGLVRRLNGVIVVNRSSNQFSIRPLELGELQWQTDPPASISTLLGHVEKWTAVALPYAVDDDFSLFPWSRRSRRRFARILHEFEQDSVGGTRMDEGHQPAMSASARFRIDELEAFGLESAH